MEILGIDIGGSAIKGAPVVIETGELATPRFRLPTPEGGKPIPMIDLIGEIAQNFQWSGPIGCGYPGVVRNGMTLSAANVSKKWVGLEAERLISEKTGCPTRVINDADAAGMAEMRYGAGRGRKGVVFIVTIGTGLGTAIFSDGYLLPNTELGHMELGGEDAEWRASDAARKRENLSWKKWAERFSRYLNMLEKLFSPDLFILGGGGSHRYNEFSQYLNVSTEILTAQLLNDAGIVGAALAGLPLLESATEVQADQAG